jgi:hypothetical protein
MSSSSGVGNGACGRDIIHRRGGRAGRGGVLEDPLPLRRGLHFHREITLPMGDMGRVANVVISELN